MDAWNTNGLYDFGLFETDEHGRVIETIVELKAAYDCVPMFDYPSRLAPQRTVDPAKVIYIDASVSRLWYDPEPVSESNFPRSLFERCQKVQVKNSWADAGRKLEELQSVYQGLRSWLETPVRLDATPLDEIDASGNRPSGWITNSLLVRFVEKYIERITSTESLCVPVNAGLKHLLRLAKAMTQMLRIAATLIREIAGLVLTGLSVFATFCGLAWPKRAWYLLHGSHPPKPELGLSGLAFGCA